MVENVPKQNLLIEKTLAIRNQIGERFEQGKLFYERDILTLNHELKLMEQAREFVTAGRMHTLMGVIEIQRGEYALALEHFQRALDHYTTANDEEEINCLLINLGEVSRVWGKTEDALAYFQQAQEMAQRREDWGKVATLLTNTGLIRLERQQAQEAVLLFERSLAYRQRQSEAGHTAHPGLVAETYDGIARAYLAQDAGERAWAAAQQALALAEENQLHIAQGTAYCTLGIIAAQTGHGDEAPAAYFARSREILSAVEAEADHARTLLAESRWLLQGDPNHRQALDQLAEAQTVFIRRNLVPELAECQSLQAKMQMTI